MFAAHAASDNDATFEAVKHVDATRVNRTEVRELPKNIEAEQVVLGSAILEPESTMPMLSEKLVPSDFYERRHRVIFRAISELFERNEPADIILLANRLEETDDMERAGGRMYLNELLDRTTTTASVEYYADIVKRKATLRALIESGGQISELGFDEASETEVILDKAEQLIFGISTGDKGDTYYLIKEFVRDHISHLEELQKNPDGHALSGFSTGFHQLDEMTSGMQRSDLAILAGRPGTGKTSLLLAFARHMAIREKARIGIFSLEMKKEALLERLLCGEAKLNLHLLRSGRMASAAKWRDLNSAAGKLHASTIIVDDSPGASIIEIRARARRMAARYGLDVIMLDYLQLVEGGKSAESREKEVAFISRSLKKLARELDVCVIAASQLNRGLEGRTEKRPRLADLRESGAIEQDADIVMFVYREDYHRQQDEGGKGEPSDTSAETELIIAKQRNGPVGNVDLMFHKSYASFYPVVGE